MSRQRQQQKREERALRVTRQYTTPIELHLEERMKRQHELPTLECVDESLLETEPDFDKARFQTAVEFYHHSDIRLMIQHELGMSDTVARPTADGGIRISEPSPAQDLALALRIFRARYHNELFSCGKTPILVDMGSYDGRVVVLAGLLGFSAYGIEIDPQSYAVGQKTSAELRQRITDIKEPHLLFGDYTQEKSFRELGIHVRSVDVFFNYDDSNADKVAAMMIAHGQAGARLLLHSYMENRHGLPLCLEAMINTPGGPIPTYDVFRRR